MEFLSYRRAKLLSAAGIHNHVGRGNVVFCCHVRRAAFVSDTEFFRQSRAGSPSAVEGNRYASGKL